MNSRPIALLVISIVHGCGFSFARAYEQRTSVFAKADPPSRESPQPQVTRLPRRDRSTA
jgi:hypothetical protein